MAFDAFTDKAAVFRRLKAKPENKVRPPAIPLPPNACPARQPDLPVPQI
jgi:hypothetical protein